MRELDDTALERRLREVLKDHLGALPLDLTVDALDRRRGARNVERRFGRRRGMTLLAAAALFLVGGALVGSGILRVPPVLPTMPPPSGIAVASPGPNQSGAPSASPIAVAGPGGVWIPTGSMLTPREEHSVRLLDGRVLVVGQSGGEFDPATAELYDPASGTWSATGSMLAPLYGLPPTLLLDGRVLVGDEVDGHYGQGDFFGHELYDPATGTWTATSRMVGDVPGDTPTVLQDGRVLALNGGGAQVYDPASGTWTATGKMNDRGYETAALLSDGKVLVAGGQGFRGGIDYYLLDSAQVYDPVTGSWTAIANMHAKTRTAAAFLQPDGKVLVLGSASGPSFHAEVYDPATGTWTELPVRAGIRYGTATQLSDGAVLVFGVTDAEPAACTADLYDPHTASWTATSMLRCGGGSFTLLLDGTVLNAHGSSSELYVPAGVALPRLPAFPSPPPPVFPSPTPVPTPLPPAAGPVPPNARSWTVTVDNRSSEPAALFVADDTLRLVGSATPNVVPAGATMEVTFLFPVDGGGIYVNPRPGDGALVVAADIGIPGKIVIGLLGGDGAGWLSR